MAAIAVGALAAFAIYSYVGGLEDKANEDARTTPAMRVVTQIERGTPGLDARAALEEVQIPQALVTGAEITQDELGAGLIDSKIAGSTLVPGQILVEGMFVDPLSSRITGADRIPDGNVAITISVDNIRGVAGLIVPGDFINMMSLPEDICDAPADPGAGDTGTTEGGTTNVPSYGTVDPPSGVPGSEIVGGICTPASMIFQKVQVLFVDRSPIPLAGDTATETVNPDGTVTDANLVDTGLITLAVPTDAAQIIASLPSESWYLTLLPPDYTPGPIPDFDPIIELWPGEDPNKLTPYGPGGLDTSATP